MLAAQSPGPSMPDLFVGLLRVRSFRRYFGAYICFMIGRSMITVITPLLVLAATGSAALTAVAASMNLIPFVVLGVVAGAISDHLDRRRVMTIALVIAAISCLIPLLPAGGWHPAAVVLSVAVVVGTADVWHTVSHFGTLPTLVERRRLVEAASLLQTANTVIGLFTPLSAILVLALAGPRPLYAAASIAFVAAALLRWRAVDGETRTAAVPLRRVVRGLPRDIGEGFALTIRNPLLRLITATGFLGNVGHGAVFGLIAVYLFVEFDVPADDPVQGYFLTAGALGVVLQMWILPVLRRHWWPPATIAVLQTCVLAGALGLAFSHDLRVSLVCFAVLTGWASMLFTNVQSLRMEMLPNELQGRVGSISRVMAVCGTPLGAIAGGLLVPALGVRGVFVSTLVVWGLSYLLLWRNRHVRDAGLVPRENPAAPAVVHPDDQKVT